MRAKRGSTIIWGIIFLTFFLLIGVTFVSLTRIEREISLRYIDQFRAKMVAQDGVEYAFNRLASLSPKELLIDHRGDWRYWGEDYNQNRELDLTEDQNHNEILDIIECDVEDVLFPSWAVKDARGRPLLKKIGRRKIGFSGETKGTYYPGGDIYILKITDSTCRIYLNNPAPSARLLLNNLGAILGIDKRLGNLIGQGQKERGLDKFTVKEELIPLVGEEIYKQIQPYVTVYGKPNPKVILPKPLEKRPGYLLNGPLKIGMDIFARSQLNPGEISLTERVPININTASQPVLVATLANLDGVYLAEASDEAADSVIEGGVTKPAQSYYYPWQEKDESVESNKVQGPKIGVLKSVRIDLALAIRLAHWIIEEREQDPFLSWQQFNQFCDHLVSQGFFGSLVSAQESELAQARADLVKANANPNTLLNDFNPNKVINGLVDKSDLLIHTTEFCFQSSGLFELESLGLVSQNITRFEYEEGPAFRSREVEKLFSQTVAKHRIRTVIDLGVQVYETTQADFARGKIGLAREQKLTHRGATLQTYPEPDHGDYPAQCVSDGQILLATNRAGASNQASFQHHFSDDFRADQAAGNPELVTETGAVNRPHNQSIMAQGGQGPGSLYPDGAYSELASCPSYQAEDNFIDGVDSGRFRGTISFWFKPNYAGFSVKPRVLFSLTKAISNTPDTESQYQSCQNIFEIFAFPDNYFGKGYVSDRLKIEPKGQLVWFWDIDTAKGNRPDEYILAAPAEMNNAHQWVHLGIAWDSKPPKKDVIEPCGYCDNSGRVFLTRQTGAEGIQVTCRKCKGTGVRKYQVRPPQVYTFMLNGRDISQSIHHPPDLWPPEIKELLDLSSDNLIRFGERFSSLIWNSSGDFTIDEVTVQLHDNVDQAKEFIMEEFKQGRYYKGEGVFSSGLIEIPLRDVIGVAHGEDTTIPDMIKSLVTWTVYYPRAWNVTGRKTEVQLVNEKGKTLFQVLKDNQGSGLFIPLTQVLGSEGEKDIDKGVIKFRYRVFFRTDDDRNQALLASPVVDDITLTLIKPDPQIIEWYVIP
ncbi:hypothetical protein ACFL5I_00390 [Planctomycetota bacterium]